MAAKMEDFLAQVLGTSTAPTPVNTASPPLEIGNCEICQKQTKKRCSRCKSAKFCSAQCQKAGWTEHKKVCSEPPAPAPSTTPAQEVSPYILHERYPKHFGNGQTGVQVMLTADNADAIQKLTGQSMEILEKYGLTEAPTKKSKMPTKLKLEFFLENMVLYDSSEPHNIAAYKDSPGVLLLMNRRYNNTYKHAIEHLTPRELNQLHQEMQRRRIGSSYKQRG